MKKMPALLGFIILFSIPEFAQAPSGSDVLKEIDKKSCL